MQAGAPCSRRCREMVAKTSFGERLPLREFSDPILELHERTKFSQYYVMVFEKQRVGLDVNGCQRLGPSSRAAYGALSDFLSSFGEGKWAGWVGEG